MNIDYSQFYRGTTNIPSYGNEMCIRDSVKAVVDKYGGDMVLSCDENEFKAVVIDVYKRQ